MRTSSLVLITLVVSSCLGLVRQVRAQDNVEKGNPHGRWKEIIDQLPGGERVKVKAVHALAMEDRAVRVANEKRKQADTKFHDILRATMLRIDPTIQPILDKVRESKKHHHWR